MKIFKFMTLALVAMLGFSSCSEDCDHNFIEIDHSADLVGTWTCLTADYAEALVIKADGSVVSTGVEDGEYWENVVGNIVVENGTVTMTFEDGDNFKGHFDIVPSVAFSIFTEDGEHMTYNYCKEDLSDEVVGMWVYQNGEDMAIQTFTEDGKLITTAPSSDLHTENLVQHISEYKVVGDLRFQLFLEETIEHNRCLPARMVYSSNGTTLGDLLSFTFYVPTNNGFVEMTGTNLRVKQGLNLNGKTYDYKSAYVTNAKGKDEDFSILGATFNITNITSDNFDVIFGSELYFIELNANSITHKFRPNGQEIEVTTPITVDGNKVTLDMTPVNSACRAVEMYMFQDADNSLLHMYMPTKSFINYFVNLEIPALIEAGKLDTNNSAAVEKLFADMEARIESINVSFVFKTRK